MVRIDEEYRTYLQGIMSDSVSSGTDDEEDISDATPRFVNERAAGRYNRSIFRHILVERKFEAPTPTFDEAIGHYGWEPLTLAPATANVEIAREYYVNAKSSDPNWINYYGVYLRGTYLRVTSNTINQHFHLPEYPDGEYDEYEQLMAADNVDDLIESVGLPGASWVCNARSEPVFIKTKDLTAEARMWLLFINSRLLPTNINTRATRERILLIYAIQHRMTIDVGKIIMQSIQSAQDCTGMPIFFPLLLSQMACRKGIHIDPEEYSRHSLGTIGTPQWQSYLETESQERLRRNA